MKHLTDDQLSALLDGALPAAELAACESHLAGCDACRARLAEAGALDATLGASLEHDPGEAYFESFADRVAARIAAEGAGAGAGAGAADSPRPEAANIGWRWLLSPRGLALSASTAALLVVAGLAFMRFQGRGSDVAELREPSPVGSALRREAAPEPEPLAAQSAPQEASRDDQVATGPAETPAVPAPSQAARMRQVQPGEGGEPVPVGTPAAPAPARDAATTTPLGRMKQKAAAPATGDLALQSAPAPQAATAPAPAGKRAAEATSNESRAAAPAPAAEAERSAVARAEQGTGAAAEALSPCGTVRDSRGQPVAGAQVLVVNDVTRTARTGPDGSFCLPRLEPGDVLSVMRVGYESVRLTMGEQAPLAVVMEPVGTLGPEAGKALTAPGMPSASGQGPAWTTPPRALTLTPASPAAPAPDVYAAQSAEVRDAVAAAREASRLARRDRKATALDAAAARWDAIAALVAGAALHDARFQALSLRRGSLSAEPTPDRLARLREGLRVFLAQAPRTLPEYATARQWQAELDAGTKSLYR